MEDILGMDVGGTKMLFHIEHGGKVIEKSIPTGFYFTREQLIKNILDFIKELGFPIKAVGIAVPSLVENNAITVSEDSKLLIGFCGDDFKDQPYKVSLINDIRSATLWESRKYPVESTIAVIVNGTGTAVGIVENGRLFKGSRGWAGELSFLPYVIDGEVKISEDIMCGKGILQRSNCDIKTLLEKIEANDPKVLKVVEEAATHFGYSLATVIALFNPSHLIYAGRTCQFKGYMETALKTLNKYCLKCSLDACKIIESEDGHQLVLKGALLHGKMEFEKQQSLDSKK